LDPEVSLDLKENEETPDHQERKDQQVHPDLLVRPDHSVQEANVEKKDLRVRMVLLASAVALVTRVHLEQLD
jgi:hypothetical protein